MRIMPSGTVSGACTTIKQPLSPTGLIAIAEKPILNMTSSSLPNPVVDCLNDSIDELIVVMKPPSISGGSLFSGEAQDESNMPSLSANIITQAPDSLSAISDNNSFILVSATRVHLLSPNYFFAFADPPLQT